MLRPIIQGNLYKKCIEKCLAFSQLTHLDMQCTSQISFFLHFHFFLNQQVIFLFTKWKQFADRTIQYKIRASLRHASRMANWWQTLKTFNSNMFYLFFLLIALGLAHIQRWALWGFYRRISLLLEHEQLDVQMHRPHLIATAQLVLHDPILECIQPILLFPFFTTIHRPVNIFENTKNPQLLKTKNTWTLVILRTKKNIYIRGNIHLRHY